jgi:hypothetical protein
MADIFISYKSERRAAAEHLAKILRAHGYSVWFDYGLLSGRDFGAQIERELRAAKAVLVLWCTKSIGSTWVREEAELAKRLDKIVPVKIEALDLPLGFGLAQTLNLSEWDGAPRSADLDRVLRDVAHYVGRGPRPNEEELDRIELHWRRAGMPTMAQFALITDIERSGRHFTFGTVDPPKGTSGLIRLWDWLAGRRREIMLFGGAGIGGAVVMSLVWAAMGNRQPEPNAGKLEVDTPAAPIEAPAAPVAAPAAPAVPDRTPVQRALQAALSGGPVAGREFRDCDACPIMVAIPPGKFLMGSPATEAGRFDHEGPQREVTIAKAFAVGKFEVTFDDWEACVAGGGCQTNTSPGDRGWGKGARPVINVSWNDAQDFVRWLSAKTGQTYRLFSEAEWEYAARAGTTTPFSFGATISTAQANYDGNHTYGGGVKGEYREKTAPVGSFPANAFGLHDMHGNVWE